MSDDTPRSDPLTLLLRRWPRSGVRLAELGSMTASLLVAFPVAIVLFVLPVVLGSLTVGLLVLYPLALLLLAAWLLAVHGGARLQRWRVRTLHGVVVPAPRRGTPQGSWHARLWATARHRDTWRAFAHHLLHLPLSALTFAVVVLAWSIPLALLLAPLSLIGTPWSAVSPLGAVPVVLGPFLALALAPMVPTTVRALADLDSAVTGALLGPSDTDRLGRRVEELRTSRSEMVDVAEQERRRIERDLHDGAGQQLVSLAMTLGMAREKLRTDPVRAQELVDEAHAEAKRALVGLRDTVRGISPAILSDRGLGPALSSVAGRSSLPVRLHVDVPRRPDQVTEGIAYYVVCEAIGNAIRHADASEVEVRVTRRGDRLELWIRDDGNGDADPSRGTGLRGLAGRVGAVDGTFSATSPKGGPTVIEVSLPIRTDAPTSVQR